MSNDNENYFQSEIIDGIAVVSEVGPDDVLESLDGLRSQLGPYAGVARALASWAEDSHPRNRSRGLFQSNKYVTPSSVYGQMQVAYDALDDDVVGNVADVSEAMAFQRVTFETEQD